MRRYIAHVSLQPAASMYCIQDGFIEYIYLMDVITSIVIADNVETPQPEGIGLRAVLLQSVQEGMVGQRYAAGFLGSTRSTYTINFNEALRAWQADSINDVMVFDGRQQVHPDELAMRCCVSLLKLCYSY